MLIHPGRAVVQQCASSSIVWIVVAVHSEVVIFEHLAILLKENKSVQLQVSKVTVKLRD